MGVATSLPVTNQTVVTDSVALLYTGVNNLDLWQQMDSHSTMRNCQALVYSPTSLLTTLVDPFTRNLEKPRGLEREKKVLDT